MANECIYSLYDTNTLESYIWNNRDMFDLAVDEETGEEISDDAAEAIVQKVVGKSTDGRLKQMFAECFDTWVGNEFSDMLYETLDDFIYMAIGEVDKED